MLIILAILLNQDQEFIKRIKKEKVPKDGGVFSLGWSLNG